MLLEGGHTVCQGQRLSLHYFWVFGALHNACYMVDAQKLLFFFQKLLNECNPFGWKAAVSNAADPK